MTLLEAITITSISQMRRVKHKWTLWCALQHNPLGQKNSFLYCY